MLMCGASRRRGATSELDFGGFRTTSFRLSLFSFLDGVRSFGSRALFT